MKTRLISLGCWLGAIAIAFGLATLAHHWGWYWVFMAGSSIWAVIDSRRARLRRYHTGIASGPVIVFVLLLIIGWTIVFPWYLGMRLKIWAGVARVREEYKPWRVSDLKVRSLSSCPMTVKISAAFWVTNCAFSSVRYAEFLNWKDWVDCQSFAMALALWLLVAWFLLQGKRWARWVVLVFFALSVLNILRLLSRLPESSIYEAVMFCLPVIINIGAGWLLLTDSARGWFRKEAAVLVAPDVATPAPSNPLPTL